jgi:hypothetical protein
VSHFYASRAFTAVCLSRCISIGFAMIKRFFSSRTSNAGNVFAHFKEVHIERRVKQNEKLKEVSYNYCSGMLNDSFIKYYLVINQFQIQSRYLGSTL